MDRIIEYEIIIYFSRRNWRSAHENVARNREKSYSLESFLSRQTMLKLKL